MALTLMLTLLDAARDLGASRCPIGVYSAVKKYSIGDYFVTVLGFLGLAIPSFLLALVLMYVAVVSFRAGGRRAVLRAVPARRRGASAKVVDLMQHLWIPVIILAVSGTASLIRDHARQHAGRAAQALRHHGARQGPLASSGCW